MENLVIKVNQYMLIKESLKIKEIINNINLPAGIEILNIGSQNEEYLNQQCYIVENIINPCFERGYKIINLDIKPGKGVDIVGDICEENTQKILRSKKFPIIFLFNILEHVPDIEAMCKSIENIIHKGSLILFSGPYEYPKHLDPIDNLFRPNPNDLSGYFSNSKIIESEILEDYNYTYYLFKNKKLLLRTIIRILSPFYKFKKWRTIVIPKLKYLNKNYKTTCVLLKKNG